MSWPASAPQNERTPMVTGKRSSFQRPLPPLPPPGWFYWTMHALPRYVWPLFGRLTVEGRENIPATGAFLLLSNHQSVLDPFFIQTFVPRLCHPMAKSTQFTSPVVTWVMRHVYSFPVRRFQVDPQAVRATLRRLHASVPVHIYVEGERTWDGTMRTPRPGTVRLILKAGVPIVPCAVEGAYEVWPRWDRRFRRGDVHVTFGKPFGLPQLDDRRDREAALPAATARIMAEIQALLRVQPTPANGADDT